MHSSHYIQNSRSTHIPAIPNEDFVLQQFYEQRNRRSKGSSKRHSLLEKNSSYFNALNSTTSQIQQNTEPNNEKIKKFFEEQSSDKIIPKIQKPTVRNVDALQNISNGNSGTPKQMYKKENSLQIFGTVGTVTKQQIKERNLKLSEQDILNKYRNLCKQNFAAPTTPKIAASLSTKDREKNLQDSFAKQKSNERKKILHQLQSNFKALTGQDPYNPKVKVLQQRPTFFEEQQLDSINAQKKRSKNNSSTSMNIKEKLQSYVSNSMNIAEQLQDSWQNKNKRHNIHEDIKIVNRVRASSTKNNHKDQMISIKNIVINNSFCHNEDEDEPLVVLANANSRIFHNEKVQNYIEKQLEQTEEIGEKAFHQESVQESHQISEQMESPNFKMNSSWADKQECEEFSRESKEKQPISNLVESKKERRKIKKYQEYLIEFQKQDKSTNLKESREKTKNGMKDSVKNSKVRRLESEKQKQSIVKESSFRASEQNYAQEIRNLKKKVEELQKTNRKQNKFIQSVQGMRRAIEKENINCNLKELWRWLKSLPTKM